MPHCKCHVGFMQTGPDTCEPCDGSTDTCSDNEEWTECKHECGQHCDMEAGCGTDEGPCTPGCKCKKGFFRNMEGICVDAYACEPQECPDPHSFWEPCNGRCWTECREDGSFVQHCTEDSADWYCIPHCTCAEGFIWTGPETNTCEPCGGTTGSCTDNEEWTECKHECGRHCDLEAGCGIDEGPCQAGCTCKQGFFRNSEGRVAAVNPKSEIITKIQ